MLELNNDLPTYGWLASNGDHLQIYDGSSTEAPLIYNSQTNNGIVDGIFVASSGNELTLQLTSNVTSSCTDGAGYQLDMLLYGASPPILGCMHEPACNYNPEAMLEDPASPCEYLSCRNLGDPIQWTYCYGNNRHEVFTLHNSSGTEIILELNHDLPTWPWLASSGDHFRVYDGLDTDAPLIHDSQENNGVVDGTFVASSGTSLTLELVTNTTTSCETGDSFQLDMLVYGAPPPVVGCMDDQACNYDGCAHLDAATSLCEYLNCRTITEMEPFSYCYGNDEDTSFVFSNPEGGEVLLELNNDLPTYPWLASNGDHLQIYDGATDSAPLLYTSQTDNGVTDSLLVVSTGSALTARVTSNGTNSCASGGDFLISMVARYAAPVAPCSDGDGDGVCDDWEIWGCTYPSALNYPGCATEEDGSCLFQQTTCATDLNQDWIITIQDVLGLLAEFGNTCEGYTGEVEGDCIYPNALNYNPSATIDDGSCIFESPCPGDVNGDLAVTISDLLTMMTVYSTSCE